MGTDFKCGCRVSMGHWFLCLTHEAMLEVILEEVKDSEGDREAEGQVEESMFCSKH